MTQEKKSKTKLMLIAVSVAVVVAGLGVWISMTGSKKASAVVDTSAAQQTTEEKKADKYVGGAHESRDLTKTELSPEVKNMIETWQKDGFIKTLKTSEHEVWINGETWGTYTMEQKNEIADTLSAYMKAYDGTPQVMVRDFATNNMLAEILGNYRDFN